MRGLIILLVAGCALPAQTSASFAGVYQPDFLLASDIDKQGFAEAIPLDDFLTRLFIIKKVDNPNSDDAKALRQKIAAAAAKANPTPDDKVKLAVDLLRFRNDASSVVDALNLLQPLSQRPPRGMEFLVQSLLAQAFFTHKNFEEAMKWQYSSVKDYDFPDKLPGLTPEQLRWYRRLETDYALPFFKNRMQTSSQTTKGLEAPDPLFPVPVKGKSFDPIRFVGPSGQFEAGTIAESEKAKLPRDCIAIVQQLLLWHPDDAPLWWLLAELYNAHGNLKDSVRVFKVCAENFIITDSQFRLHRNAVLSAAAPLLEKEAKEEEAVKTAVAEQARKFEEVKKAEQEKKQMAQKQQLEEQQQAEQEQRKKYLWAGAGIATVLMFVGYWQAKEILRRIQNRRPK